MKPYKLPIPGDFCEWPREAKMDYLFALPDDPDLNNEEIDTLITCLEKEPSDQNRSLMIQLFGGYMKVAEVRDALTGINSEFIQEPATRDSLLVLVIAARFYETGDVHTWGKSLLNRVSRLNAEDPVRLQSYFLDILRDENRTPALRRQAALGLAQIGKQDGLEGLLEFGDKIASDFTASDQRKADAEKPEIWELGIIADAIWEGSDKIVDTGLLKRSEQLLHRMVGIIEEPNRTIAEAQKRIGELRPQSENPIETSADLPHTTTYGSFGTEHSRHPAAGFLSRLGQWLRMPSLLGAAAAAGILAAVAILPLVMPSDAPEFQKLVLTGITKEGYTVQMGPTLRIRGPSPEAFVLQSGEHVSLSFIPDEDGHVTVILLDNREETHVLFSEPVRAGQEIRLPKSADKFPLGYPLDEHAGVETFVVIATEQPISPEEMEIGLVHLQRDGPDAVQDLYSDALVEVLRFRHE